ncbi:prepilin-type N-terminal cleavage/methylation domain-containing protein [Thiogranum longum]|uniref:Prepilin-type N-terminal cleavage/methylation domain-containing protein n=1 Tax=Thiogranum longum TaxID=1537524 RepID=A0A4V2PGH6_9GAMM|nr:type II secretion system protein [Thiogranum longum]TCK16876.1 prepilin-type N-terminal cleavage/methylation domain-containing protein [Thiogranum longum]
MNCPDRKCCSGFTLLELIAVIVILAIAAVPISGLFTKASLSLLENRSIQTATQLAQEQAELILGRRRTQGFASIITGTYPEVLAGNYTGFNRTTSISQPVTAPAGCPAGALCDLVTVSVDKGASPLSEITFVLVDY